MTFGGLGRALVIPGMAALVIATAGSASARHSDDPSDPTSAAPGAETVASHATVVLVGDIREGDELVLLLRELLGRQGVACEFSETARFDPDALFAESEAEAKVRVFIRLAEGGRARLYFRGPSGERFLLRTIALPSGLDEVGRELVGQVVESSVVTLLRSSSGLSREEASAEVARETVTEPPPTRARTPPPESRKSSERTFGFSLALRYALESFGPDLGLAHGPGLELGVGTLGAIRLRGRVSGEWFFDQTVDTPELEATVKTRPLRAGVDVGFRLAAVHLLALGVSAGVDLSRAEPGAPRSDDVTPGESQSSLVPMLRPELRYELGARGVVGSASAFVDMSLARTHYDLLENGGPVRVATPWLVRPGGALLVGVVW
jgi:hypothetical protein